MWSLPANAEAMGHCTEPYTNNIKIRHAIIAIIVTRAAAAVLAEVMITDYEWWWWWWWWRWQQYVPQHLKMCLKVALPDRCHTLMAVYNQSSIK